MDHLGIHLPEIVGQVAGHLHGGEPLTVEDVTLTNAGSYEIRLGFRHRYGQAWFKVELGPSTSPYRFYRNIDFIDLQTPLLRVRARYLRPHLAHLAAVLPADLVRYLARAM